MNELKELKKVLIERQNILSQLTRKWTIDEMKDYDEILNESQIKSEIFNNNINLFDDIEIGMLKRCLK